jgi:hypothetical protein
MKIIKSLYLLTALAVVAAPVVFAKVTLRMAVTN